MNDPDPVPPGFDLSEWRSRPTPATAGHRCPATRTMSFGYGFTCGLTVGHEGKHVDPATATGWADEDFEPAELCRHV